MMLNSDIKTQTADIYAITASMNNLQVSPQDPVHDLTNQLSSTTLASSTCYNPHHQLVSIRSRAVEPQSEAVILQYGHYLSFTGDALADSDLPSNLSELEALGFYISDELLRRYQAGEVVNAVFSPLGHPCYPRWLAVHEVNDVIIRVYEEMEGLERAMGGMDIF
jgi:hypothetical protein